MTLDPNVLRKHILEMIKNANSGHIGGSFSIAEVVAYLYSNYDLLSDKGDKLILSKGHAVPAIYAALYELGAINKEDFSKFRKIDSPLQGHPDKVRLKYMHATTGALGQGLSIAIGHAIAMKIKDSDKKIFCIVGDGELQEGQIWEALMLAPKYNLNNLYCIVDYNKAQNDGLVKDILDLEPLDEKIRSFGWEVHKFDGNDMTQIESHFNMSPTKPCCFIMDTRKGCGVSFMESAEWHAKAPNQEEYEKAVLELEKC